MSEKKTVTEFVRANYNNPGHPIAFSSPNKVYKYLKDNDKYLPLHEVQDLLAEFDAHNRHKEYHRPKYFNPYYIFSRREQIQADLIDVRQLSRQNNGVNYLFLLIDCFSKKVWVYPLKRKTGEEVSEAFRTHIESDPETRIFKELAVDAGKEFFNTKMSLVLERFAIHIQKTAGYNKNSIAERANRSIQLLLYKYMTQNETLKYVDKLNELVATYNARSHRTLNGLSPNEADLPENEVLVRGIHQQRFSSIKRATRFEIKKMFQVGDIVRIKQLSARISSLSRSYMPQYMSSYYIVREVDTRSPRVQFHIKAMDTNENIIGGFYRNELSAVKGNVWKIEKILKSRGKGKNLQHLVRWANFSPDWDSWISSQDILQRYN